MFNKSNKARWQPAKLKTKKRLFTVALIEVLCAFIICSVLSVGWLIDKPCFYCQLVQSFLSRRQGIYVCLLLLVCFEL
jgi:hypothetical protein